MTVDEVAQFEQLYKNLVTEQDYTRYLGLVVELNELLKNKGDRLRAKYVQYPKV
jgi:hypothetical protein